MSYDWYRKSYLSLYPMPDPNPIPLHRSELSSTPEWLRQGGYHLYGYKHDDVGPPNHGSCFDTSLKWIEYQPKRANIVVLALESFLHHGYHRDIKTLSLLLF